MQITSLHRERFSFSFIVIFYFLAVYKLANHLWLFQQEPYFFVNRFDFTTWLFMATGIHKWPLGNVNRLLFFDLCFYAMPLIWFLTNRFDKISGSIVAFAWLLVNWIYVQCYTLYPINSIESHIAWLLMPLLFATTNSKQFYFVMHGLRYFFLFFVASAGIWKLRQGGIFYPQELSGILLKQHEAYLVSAPADWQSKFIYWLIRNPAPGHFLYVSATLLELSFITGFFTRKFDRVLVIAFMLFLVMDMLVMRIPYFEVMPLLLPLMFSKYEEPKRD